jgi:hypothetical protein
MGSPSESAPSCNEDHDDLFAKDLSHQSNYDVDGLVIGEELDVGLAENNPSEPDFPFYRKEDWCEKTCCVLNYAGIQIIEVRITTCDPREPGNGEFLVSHVRETIFNCKDKSQIMIFASGSCLKQCIIVRFW